MSIKKSITYKHIIVVFCLNFGILAMQSLVYAGSEPETGKQKSHEQMNHHESIDHGNAPHKHDEHANHSKHLEKIKSSTVSRSVVNYKIPDLTLVNKAGEKVSVIEELSPDKPILLNFIFTTCSTICPVMSATFSQVQKLLGSEIKDIQMVSISIDPEQDTAEKLRAYAKKIKANEQWSFLTGKSSDILTVLHAFDTYRGSKMNHIPVTLMRKTKHDPWIRLEGLTTAQELVGEYRQLTSG